MTKLTAEELVEGIWRGVLQTDGLAEPEIRVTHLGKEVPDWALQAVPGSPDTWRLEVPVPNSAIADGVQTIVISDVESGAVLGQITLVAGQAMAGDLQAEVALLRAELDLLKQAFRAHCAE